MVQLGGGQLVEAADKNLVLLNHKSGERLDIVPGGKEEEERNVWRK